MEYARWLREQRQRVRQECVQFRAGVVQEALALRDMMRTYFPRDSFWSTVDRGALRDALHGAFAGARAVAVAFVADSRAVTRTERKESEPVAPPPPRRRPVRYGPKEGAVHEDDDMPPNPLHTLHAAMSHLLFDVILQGKGKRTFATEKEAFYHFHSVYLAQFNQRCRTWAARDDVNERAAYLVTHPSRDDDEGAGAPDAAITLQWASECLLYATNEVPTERELRPGMGDQPPNLPLVDRPQDPLAEQQALHALFKQMQWTWSMAERPLTLAHIVLGTGILPSILVAAAAGKLPWVVRLPLDGEGGADLDSFVTAGDAGYRAAVETAKQALRGAPPSVPPRLAPNAPFAQTEEELERRGALPVGRVPRRESARSHTRTAIDLLRSHLREHIVAPLVGPTITHWLRSLTSFPVSEALVGVLGILTQLAVVETFGPDVDVPSDGEDDAVLTELLATLLGYDAVKTVLARFGDPAGAVDVERIEGFKREATYAVYGTMLQRTLARMLDRMPRWLFEAMAELRTVAHVGNYGPLDLNDGGGESTLAVVLREWTVAMDVQTLSTRALLYLFLFRRQLARWQTERPPQTFYAYVRSFFSSASVAKHDEAARFLRFVQLFKAGWRETIVRTLGLLGVGAACYAALPLSVCGIPAAWTTIERYCREAVWTGGVHADALLALLEAGRAFASPRSMGLTKLTGLPVGATLDLVDWLRLHPTAERPVHQRMAAWMDLAEVWGRRLVPRDWTGSCVDYVVSAVTGGSAATDVKRELIIMLRELVLKAVPVDMIVNGLRLKHAMRHHFARLNLLL